MFDPSKINIQFTAEGRTYNVNLYAAEAEDKIRLNVGGKIFTFMGDADIPESARMLFESLNGGVFTSNSDLMARLSGAGNIDGISLTKRIYDIGSGKLLHKDKVDSDSILKLKKEACEKLSKCEATDKEKIGEIITRSRCSTRVIFDIANEIESSGKVELAHAIRKIARPFDLESTIGIISKQLADYYFDPKIGAECEAFVMRKLAEGGYAQFEDPEEFARQVSVDLRLVSHDKHFELMVRSSPPFSTEGEAARNEREAAEQLKGLKESNFGFGKLRNEEGICILEINSMENPERVYEGRKQAQEIATRLMNEIRDSHPSAVVLDVRRNKGGSPLMAELILSYFTPPGLPLSSFAYNKFIPVEEGDRLTFPVKTCRTWSLDRLPEVQRMLEVPVCVLTGPYTFSAGEDLTCHFKGIRRAKLIGQTTGGGANPARCFDVGRQFVLALPITEVHVPYGRNWEGTGIFPDIEIPPTSDALAAAKAFLRSPKS